MRIINAHQHFWSLATPGHEWPTAAEAAIHRDFGPADLRAAAGGVPLAMSVLVRSKGQSMKAPVPPAFSMRSMVGAIEPGDGDRAPLVMDRRGARPAA